MKDLELLAPARNADIGIAAIDCGADAVYIAGPEFGARKAAGNSIEDIRRLCGYAHRFGVRQSVIGLTIVAGGTSLPELATSVVAAYKGRSAMAIGNVIGSNVFNILLILGITSVVHPMRIMGITIVDLMMMLISIGLMWIFAITKYFVSRREGWVLILTFMGYMGWLLYLL